MEKLRYCSVQPKYMESVYVYLSDEDVKIGTFVEVPFGRNDTLWKGEVVDVNFYAPEAVPFPLEKMKSIARVISKEEYEYEEHEEPETEIEEDDGLLITIDDEDWEDDLDEADSYIEEENYEAMFDWANEHRDCLESPAVMEKVRLCYELCTEQNDPVAALNLGAMYYTGQGAPQDYKEAVRLYEIAAAAGGPGGCRALCNIGYCYYYGRHQKPDYEKAYHYFSLCALLYDDPNSLYKLGDMYKNGLAVEKSDRYAFMLYDRAYRAIHREDEDPFCKADIELRIGEALLRGYVIERNVELAHAILTQALIGFYERRKEDPFVGSLIENTKALIQEAQRILDKETNRGAR